MRWYSARGPAPAPASERLYRGGKGDLRKRLLWVLGLVAFGLMLASCAPNAQQDSLQPAGPYAQEIHNLFVPVFWVAVLVFVIVEGGIVLIAIKYRHRKGRDRDAAADARQHAAGDRLDDPARGHPRVRDGAHGRDDLGPGRKPPPPSALHVTVEGHQWWWGFEYTDDDMKTEYDDQPITARGRAW